MLQYNMFTTIYADNLYNNHLYNNHLSINDISDILRIPKDKLHFCDNGLLNVECDVEITNEAVNDGNLIIYFNFVNGNFTCNPYNVYIEKKLNSSRIYPYYSSTTLLDNLDNHSHHKGEQQSYKLTSLIGCPHTICGTFDCSNNNLKSLYGSPERVWLGDFICTNNNLIDLSYSPVFLAGSFFCSHNKLKSLDDLGGLRKYKELKYSDGTVKQIVNVFNCSYNKIEKLNIVINDGIIFTAHNNRIKNIDDSLLSLCDFSLYKNPYNYFKKYNYEYD